MASLHRVRYPAVPVMGVNAEVPFPFITPVSEIAPVPPWATLTVPIETRFFEMSVNTTCDAVRFGAFMVPVNVSVLVFVFTLNTSTPPAVSTKNAPASFVVICTGPV